MADSPDDIAAAFARRWEDAWNEAGPDAAASLYTADSLLVGAAIGVGRAEIARLLGLLHRQGWTRIAIRVVAARAVGGVVLAACEFTATGSGPVAGRSLAGKSSHVLTPVDGDWLSAMHTAA